VDRLARELEKVPEPVLETGAVAVAIEPAFPTPFAGQVGLDRRGQSRVLAAAISSWTLMAVGILGITPVYPDIARDLGLKADSFGALLGIATLTAGVLQIPMGVLADRFRVKYIAVVGLVACATAPAIWALAPNFRIYALGQVAAGITIVCLQAGFHTAVAKAFRPSARAAAMSTMFVATSVGSVASLLLFGEVGGRIGWRAVALGVCWLPLLAIPVVLAMPHVSAGHAEKTIRQIGSDAVTFLLHGRAIALAGLMTLTAGSAMAVQFLIPFVLRGHSYGAGATGLLLIPFIIGGIVGSPLMGGLSDRLGPARPVAIGMTCGALALGALAALGPEPPVLIGCFLVLGTLANGGQAVLLSSTADLASTLPDVGTGSAMGITRLSMSFGPAISPTVTGWLFLRTGGTVTELLLAGVFLTAGLTAYTILRVLRPHRST